MSYYRFFSPVNMEESIEMIASVVEKIGKVSSKKATQLVGKWKSKGMLPIKFTFDLVQLPDGRIVVHANTPQLEQSEVQKTVPNDADWAMFVDEINKIHPEIGLSNEPEIRRVLYVDATGGLLAFTTKKSRARMIQQGLLIKVQFANGRISSGQARKGSTIHETHERLWEEQLRKDKKNRKRWEKGEITEDEFYDLSNEIWEFRA